MKIVYTLTQKEVEEAVRAFVRDRVPSGARIVCVRVNGSNGLACIEAEVTAEDYELEDPNPEEDH